jgi:hypothetical protein
MDCRGTQRVTTVAGGRATLHACDAAATARTLPGWGAAVQTTADGRRCTPGRHAVTRRSERIPDSLEELT